MNTLIHAIPTKLIIRLIRPYQVMALPLHLLLGLIGVNRKQKAALAALFCLGFFIIAVALVRVFQTRATKEHHVDPIWLALWSQIEASVGRYTSESFTLLTKMACSVQLSWYHAFPLSAGYSTSEFGPTPPTNDETHPHQAAPPPA